MHCLYGLKKLGYDFQLKGRISLSKGFHLINRFSEDIDLHINPPAALGINENPKNSNEKNIQKKKDCYDTLAGEIKIDGIVAVVRDTAFDDTRKYNSGGIRLQYNRYMEPVEGVKKGENSDGQSRIRFDYGLENVFASEFLVAKIKEFLEQNQNIPELSDK